MGREELEGGRSDHEEVVKASKDIKRTQGMKL